MRDLKNFKPKKFNTKWAAKYAFVEANFGSFCTIQYEEAGKAFRKINQLKEAAKNYYDKELKKIQIKEKSKVQIWY